MLVDFKADFAVEKIMALALASCFLIFLSDPYILNSYIVLGYAHFMMTHLYRARKARPTLKQAVLYFIILGGTMLLTYNFYRPFTIYIATCFLFHNFFDEFKLHGNKPLDFFHGSMILFIASVLILWFTEMMYGVDVYVYVSALFIVWASIFSLCGIYLYKSRILSLNTNSFLLGGGILFLFSLHCIDYIPRAPQIFGFIILFHFFSWYIALARWFKKKGDEGVTYRRYLKECVLANVFAIGAFTAYKTFPVELGFMQLLFFSLPAYYAWTHMHLIVTLRPLDYMNALRFRPIS